MLIAACGAGQESAEPTTTRSGQLVLGPDGLGNLDFGEPTATAMEVLVDLLGQPDPGEEYPYGGHPLRHVYWKNVGLAVVFSEYELFRDDGEEHFVGWGHSLYIGDVGELPLGPASRIGGIGAGAGPGC